MAFILTGRDDWKQWSRNHISAALYETGSDIHIKIKSPYDILVSSRDDTIKAMEAKTFGCKIITYKQLHDYLVLGNIDRNGIKYYYGSGDAIDGHKPKVEPVDMTSMQDIPGWGTF